MKVKEDSLIACLALLIAVLFLLFAVGISLYATALDNAECAQIEAGNVQDFRTEPWEGGESIDSTRKTTRYAVDPKICA